jgi:hypothetical protein
MSFPFARATLPLLPCGMVHACRLSAISPTLAVVSLQALVVPASFPRTMPCHLSGRRSSRPGVMS